MRNLISNGLRKLVKSSPTYKAGTKDAIVISVATVKGGVGKTTTAVNLAAGLAEQLGAAVLLVDLDAQAHCSSSLDDCLSDEIPDRSLSDILLEDEPFEILDAVTKTTIENVSITAADPTLADTEGRISQKIGKEFLLRDSLKVTKTHFDYIIVDCPPNKGNLTLNALLASDFVLVPTDLSPLSVQGADELLSTVSTVNYRLEHDVDILGVLLTKYDRRNSAMNETIEEQIDQAWGDLVFKTKIGTNTAISKAQLAGQSIFDFDRRTRGAKDYAAFAKEVAKATRNHAKSSSKNGQHARRKPTGSR